MQKSKKLPFSSRPRDVEQFFIFGLLEEGVVEHGYHSTHVSLFSEYYISSFDSTYFKNIFFINIQSLIPKIVFGYLNFILKIKYEFLKIIYFLIILDFYSIENLVFHAYQNSHQRHKLV